MSAAPAGARILKSLSGYQAGWIAPDLFAGLALAAVAVPEQMATANLAGAAPEAGLVAFVAGAFGFAVFGASRFLSVGADSTIAPVFGGALASFAAAGSAHYLALAAMLALMVGALVIAAGVFRMGWIADLLSAPVTVGFLAGVAVHIVLSQLPGALGVPAASGGAAAKALALARSLGRANLPTAALAAAVLAITAAAHRVNHRLPGALVAVALASMAAAVLHLSRAGVALIGPVAAAAPRLALPAISASDITALVPLALLIALICIVQTAATVRAFPDAPNRGPDLDRDLIGLGAGNAIAGLLGAFAVDGSPPRTAIVADSSARSQVAGLAAAAAIAVLALVGGGLLGTIPRAALSGILIFIALRIVRIGDMAAIARASPAEALLVAATAAAVIFLPIQIGVATGVALSILNGVWSSARPRTFPMVRLPGTTIWWPDGVAAGERVEGVEVLGFQAPLNFLNAAVFARQITEVLARPGGAPRLIVLEAAGIIDIDYTAAQTFKSVIRLCESAGTVLALARLEAVKAQHALQRFGLQAALGEGRTFNSVAEAVTALAPESKPASG
ncbi:MAG TPA: SulP family inorganic anion transporter [Caulobacteraceae bacterium]|nr:SulP family inorganic anion transporter [Caulobacteraceae bacterium]